MNETPGRPAAVTIEQEQQYRFRVRFRDGMPEIVTDEPPPVGGGEGPSPTMLLQAAIATCLASSLLFCLQKARLETQGLGAEVVMTTGRNDQGRVRVQRVQVRILPTVTDDVRQKMQRCTEVFQTFCTVTESVRAGFPVDVEVVPQAIEPAEPAR